MTRTLQIRPPRATGHGRSAVEPERLVAALAGALGASPSQQRQLRLEGQRLAGRSNIYQVISSVPVQGRSGWIVKQPHTAYSQDDIDSPASAEQEFAALTRLDRHFRGAVGPSTGRRMRVPAPVALLPELGALVMEYVPGRTSHQLISYASAVRPAALRDSLVGGGELLRHLHSLETVTWARVDLRDQSDAVLAVAAEKLPPLGLSLPAGAREILEGLPSGVVDCPQVRLHGDFGPGNVLLAEDTCIVGLDAALDSVGAPEVDLARHVAVLSGSIRFAPEVVLPPTRQVRRHLVEELLRGYYGSPLRPLRFELQLMHQLVRRWCRLTELAVRNERRPLLAARLQVIGKQMGLLIDESARRLAQ